MNYVIMKYHETKNNYNNDLIMTFPFKIYF